MQVPRPVMEKDLKTQEKELTDDINSLNKKVSMRSFGQTLRDSRL